MRKLNLGHKTKIFDPPEKEDFLKNPVLKNMETGAKLGTYAHFDFPTALSPKQITFTAFSPFDVSTS